MEHSTLSASLPKMLSLASNQLNVPFRVPCQVNKKIFVRGLPWETTDQSLRAVFEQYGEIAEVRCARRAQGDTESVMSRPLLSPGSALRDSRERT